MWSFEEIKKKQGLQVLKFFATKEMTFFFTWPVAFPLDTSTSIRALIYKINMSQETAVWQVWNDL